MLIGTAIVAWNYFLGMKEKKDRLCKSLFRWIPGLGPRVRCGTQQFYLLVRGLFIRRLIVGGGVLRTSPSMWLANCLTLGKSCRHYPGLFSHLWNKRVNLDNLWYLFLFLNPIFYITNKCNNGINEVLLRILYWYKYTLFFSNLWNCNSDKFLDTMAIIIKNQFFQDTHDAERIYYQSSFTPIKIFSPQDSKLPLKHV